MSTENHRFDNVLGEEYDLVKFVVPHYDELQQQLCKLVALHYQNSKNTIKVLEIGCGTGTTTKALLDCIPNVNIIAVDNEKKMLEHMRKNLSSWKASDKVTLVEAEIGNYLASTPDSTFDAVVSGLVIHNFEQKSKQKIISEIFRVLKSGGIFVNADKYAHDDPVVRAKVYKESIKKYDIYDGMGRSDYKKEWLEHMERDEREDLIFIEGEAKKYMNAVGFSKVTTNYREMMEAVISGVKE